MTEPSSSSATRKMGKRVGCLGCAVVVLLLVGVTGAIGWVAYQADSEPEFYAQRLTMPAETMEAAAQKLESKLERLAIWPPPTSPSRRPPVRDPSRLPGTGSSSPGRPTPPRAGLPGDSPDETPSRAATPGESPLDDRSAVGDASAGVIEPHGEPDEGRSNGGVSDDGFSEDGQDDRSREDGALEQEPFEDDDRPRWSITLTEDELNAYFATRLATDVPGLGQAGLRDPRVVFEDGQARLAFRADRGDLSGVVSLTIRPMIDEASPDMVRFEITRALLGRVPLPLALIADQIPKPALPHGLAIDWYATESGAAVEADWADALDRHHGPTRHVDRVIVEVGQITVGGFARPAPENDPADDAADDVGSEPATTGTSPDPSSQAP